MNPNSPSMDDDSDVGRRLFQDRYQGGNQEREDEFQYKDRQLDEYTLPLSGVSSESVGGSQASASYASMQSPVSPSPTRPHPPRQLSVNFADADPSYEPRGVPPELPFALSQGSGASVSVMSRDSEHNSGHMSASSASVSSVPSPRASKAPGRPTFRPSALRENSAMQLGFDGRISEMAISGVKSSDTVQTTSAMSQESVHSHSGNSLGNSINEFGSQGSEVDEGGDNFSADDGSYGSDAIEPIILCNVKFPLWLSRLLRKPPSLSRIAAFIVRTAPCFWFCGNRVQGSSTDRAVLTRLNILCAFFCFFQVGASMYLATILLIVDDQRGVLIGFAPNFWNLNGAGLSVGVLGFSLMFTCFFTIKVIQRVDLVKAIRYLWVLLWIVPFEIFFNISLFDYHRVTEVWIKHWWLEPQLSWFRDRYCPEGTVDTICLVPLYGGADYENEDDWCEAKYNSTECVEVRDGAQADMDYFLLTGYTGLAIWGICVLVLLMLMINTLERIISKPIVQKSRESNVPAWLTLPTTGCALVGSIYLYSPSSLLTSSSNSQSSWIGVVYLISAGLFFTAAMLGWFLSTFQIRNSADKKNKNMAVVLFIGVMAANTVMLATLFVASIIFSADLVNAPIDENARGEVACQVDRGASCTMCDAEISSDRCPEWILEDVTKILQTQLKQSATLAAIFILYAISALRFGFLLRKHLSLYQIDYV